MSKILKGARVEKQVVDDTDLALINAQSLVPRTAENVFTFRLAACDNQVDRDKERFTDRTLDQFSEMFVGRPVLRDHNWNGGSQTARIYAGHVESNGSVRRLILQAYMPRNERAAPVIDDIEAGILREVSVGVSVRNALCSICGEPYGDCPHLRGQIYEDEQCCVELDDAEDAYELSFVAVPAQRDAGVVKRYEAKEQKLDSVNPTGAAGDHDDPALLQAQAMQELEEKRFGGM